jgi:putative addiction module antidote
MVREITLHQTGESVTATLPKEMAERLHVGPGDRMFAVETDSGVLLTPFDPDLRDAMQAFDQIRRQYRNTLKKLAE